MDRDENPVPIMFEHCCVVFAEMMKQSEEEQVGQGVEEGSVPETIKVYEGFLTTLFQDLRMSVPYYTTIMKALKAMNCVEQLRRGGGTSKSKWVLYHEPTEEGFMAYMNGRTSPRRQGQLAALEQRNRDLAARVSEAEKRLDRIEKYLQRVVAA